MSGDLISMWHAMSWLAQGVVLLLLLMLGRAVGITLDRGLRCAAARKQSRECLPQIASALHDEHLDEAICIARRNRKSHVACVIANGLACFQGAAPFFTEAEIVEAAKRGLEHSAILVHAELKVGVSGLATIASTAPFVGLFGTVVGITNVFSGMTGQKSAVLAAMNRGISEALVTTAFGLCVAVPAVWCYNYFVGRMEAFDLEMSNSSKKLVNDLILHLHRRAQRQL